MDDKNELNDLLLGNQKESSSSKKFFLIAAGVLLLFFIIIGIMKFVGSGDTKQPLPITANEQVKKPLPPASAMPSAANNTAPDANAGATQDEKLNAIVKKLQQDAEHQANANAATQAVAVPTPTPTTQAPKQEAKVVTAPAPQPVPVVVKPAPAPAVQHTASKSTNVPIKTANEPKKEEVKKQDVKTAFKDATKNVVKKPAAKKVAKKSEGNLSAAAGSYYIQVGYFESSKSIGALGDKVSKAGYSHKTRQAVKSDKNITKVWVGPFNSKEDAQKALPKVREQIKNDAFIVKG